MTQLQIVKSKLDQYHKVSRNECLDLRITRLGALVNILKKQGYLLTAGYEHTEHGKDYIYRKQVFNPLPPAFDIKPIAEETNQGELL